MSSSLDNFSKRLLDALQDQVPLVERPFEQIARRLEVSEDEVIARVIELRGGEGGGDRAVLRQISAIFDSRTLGYRSSLVAAQVDGDRIDSAAAVISSHPGVSHNYRRNHEYNLWYTVAVPPDSSLGLAQTVALLGDLSGASVTRLMPSLKMYKIGVKFDVSGDGDSSDRVDPKTVLHKQAASVRVTERDKRMIRVLQQDLPATPRPFDAWASAAGVTVSELLAAAQQYIDTGAMRRFSAVLRHRAAGFGANAMGAWVVPQERYDEFGATAASFAAVSHCYLRPTYEDWPYSLFTMVHGKLPSECESVLEQISKHTGITSYTSLYSTHEYKKVRVKYFTPDVEHWEQRNEYASSCH
jgi:siroheme decarboxylase